MPQRTGKIDMPLFPILIRGPQLGSAVQICMYILSRPIVKENNKLLKKAIEESCMLEKRLLKDSFLKDRDKCKAPQ